MFGSAPGRDEFRAELFTRLIRVPTGLRELHLRLDELADRLDQLVDRVGLEADHGEEQRDVDGLQCAGQHHRHQGLEAVDVDRDVQQRHGVLRESVAQRRHDRRVEGADRLLLRRRGVQQRVDPQLVELDQLAVVLVAAAQQVRQAGAGLLVQGVERRERGQVTEH